VNAIAPGMFRTRMTEAIIERAEGIYNAMTPMGAAWKAKQQSRGRSYLTMTCHDRIPCGAVVLRRQCEEGILACSAACSEAGFVAHIGPQQDHTICSHVDAAIITNEG